MKPNFMRVVDYWIGVPICFLLSIIAALEKVVGLRRLKKGFKPKKILFMELSEMGSTILAYSAMLKAREMFNAELYFMIFKENEESIKILDIVPKTNIITIRSRTFLLLLVDTLAAIWKIKAKKIDTVIDLELFSRFTSILSFISGAKAIVGFYRYHMEGLYRGIFQTHKVAYNPHYHISQNFMALVQALDADLEDLPLVKREIKKSDIVCAKIKSSADAKKKILRKLQQLNHKINEKSRIVLVNPNASQLLPIRRWPLKNFMKLTAKIINIKNTFVVITGTESEKGDAGAICDFVKNERCIDFTGKTDLRELIDLYNISRIIVTNDSGPAHFSSLTNIKNIVLFGPETPKLYGPLNSNCECLYSNYACSPCVSAFNHRRTSCKNNRCLKAIKVPQVFDSVKKNLG